MREVLTALADGEIGVDEAEARLTGYATTGAGRYDAAREHRNGVPEAILGEGKSVTDVVDLGTTAVETTGRAIVTRATEEQRGALVSAVGEDTDIEIYDRARAIVVHDPSFEPPSLDATVGIVTGGTSDSPVANEAAVLAREMGADVEQVTDVGVAGIHRLIDQLDDLREMDVLIVAAGREGALPTVVAGLVDTPVIGLPVSTGYGHGGEGEAALSGLLQSCTVLSVVNIDAGFVAGAQAGLIARAITNRS